MYINRLVEKRLEDLKRHAASTQSQLEYTKTHLHELESELTELETEINELKNFLK